MKSLDDQVASPSDDSSPATTEVASAASASQQSAPRRRRKWSTGVVVTGIVVALFTGVAHLVTEGVANSAAENAAIAKIDPISKYNAPLETAVAQRRAQVADATTTLNQATYLIATKDYFALSTALVDTSTDVSEYDGDLLGKVTKSQYEDAIATLAQSGAALKAAQSAVIADMKATPAPTTTPTE